MSELFMHVPSGEVSEKSDWISNIDTEELAYNGYQDSDFNKNCLFNSYVAQGVFVQLDDEAE